MRRFTQITWLVLFAFGNSYRAGISHVFTAHDPRRASIIIVRRMLWHGTVFQFHIRHFPRILYRSAYTVAILAAANRRLRCGRSGTGPGRRSQQLPLLNRYSDMVK